MSLHRLTDERPSENMTPRSFDLLLISRVRKKLETQRRSNNRSKAERSQLGAGRHIDQRRHYGRPSNVFHRAGSGASKYYDDAYTLKNECDTITIETVETANPMAATVIGSVAHRPWGLGGGGGAMAAVPLETPMASPPTATHKERKRCRLGAKEKNRSSPAVGLRRKK